MSNSKTLTLLLGLLCLGPTVLGDETFSSRRTYQSEVSIYHKGHYSMPNGQDSYAGPRPYLGQSWPRPVGYLGQSWPRPVGYRGQAWPTGSRLSYGPQSTPGGEWEYSYSAKFTFEEEVSWTGQSPYGGSSWCGSPYPVYGGYGYYGGPYYRGAYYRPLGYGFHPYRPSYCYPSGGISIDLHLNW